MAGPKLSGCLPVRSSWTQVIRIFTSQKWQDPSYQLDPSYQDFHQSKVAGPKLSGCLPVRSSWTQVIRIFTSQKWLDPSYQAAYQLEVGPKLSGFHQSNMADPRYQTLHQSQVALDPKYQDFHQSKVAGPKLSDCLPVRSSWTQVIRIFTSSDKLSVKSGPKISGPVKSGWTQVIRLLTS